MKKIISLIVCICIAATVFFCGCFDLGGKSGRDGRDGLDGQDVSIYEIYEAAKTVPGNENLTLDEFLKKYLSYSQSELSDLVNKQKVINRSLMSSCSILSRFPTILYRRAIKYIWVLACSFGLTKPLATPTL